MSPNEIFIEVERDILKRLLEEYLAIELRYHKDGEPYKSNTATLKNPRLHHSLSIAYFCKRAELVELCRISYIEAAHNYYIAYKNCDDCPDLVLGGSSEEAAKRMSASFQAFNKLLEEFGVERI